ncbi:MAG: S-layer homology domain-containing protein, partial [Desulfocucumaceae bacterium]
MVKKITCTAMVLALAAWLAVIPPGLRAASAESFKDTTGHWSGQAVEKAYALGLMTGYPGSVFKPEDPVSRLEAIAIVIRAMGLEEQAKTLDYKNSGIALPQGMFWGQGHLVVAVKNGLLAKDSVYRLEYKGPITRYEVATLISVALRDKFSVEGDVQKLTYADTKEIPADFQKYVANVTQNNIMQGLENNRFGPNDTMKRGQMAALMARTVMDGWFAYGGVNLIKGSLETVESATGALRIAGDSLRLVDSKTGLYKGSKKASLTDFRVGDSVIGIAGPEPRFKYLELTGDTGTPGIPVTTPAETELSGRIVDRAITGGSALKIRDSAYRDHLYVLSTAVTITDGTSSRNLSYLADGQYVTVRVKDNIIQSVRTLAPTETEGEIVSINTGFLAIKTSSSGDARLFTISSPDFKITSGS